MAGPITNMVLNYNAAHYEQKIAALENYAKQLEQHLNTLEQLKGRVNEFWNDDEAITYLKALTKQIMSVRTAQNMVNNVRQTYTEAQSEIKKTKAKVTIDLSDITGITKLFSGD